MRVDLPLPETPVIHTNRPSGMARSMPCKLFPRALRRSEERRVGKECRSRCDWSSDVCSSDLDEGRLAAPRNAGYTHEQAERNGKIDALQVVPPSVAKIGRASCRERV